MKYHPYVHYILVKYLFPPTITCYYKADIRNPLRYLLMNKYIQHIIPVFQDIICIPSNDYTRLFL